MPVEDLWGVPFLKIVCGYAISFLKVVSSPVIYNIYIYMVFLVNLIYFTKQWNQVITNLSAYYIFTMPMQSDPYHGSYFCVIANSKWHTLRLKYICLNCTDITNILIFNNSAIQSNIFLQFNLNGVMNIFSQPKTGILWWGWFRDAVIHCWSPGGVILYVPNWQNTC